RMIFDPDGEPLLRWIETRTASDGPALENAIKLEPEIVVETRCRVFLNDEPPALLLCFPPLGLGRAAEVTLCPIFRQSTVVYHGALSASPAFACGGLRLAALLPHARTQGLHKIDDVSLGRSFRLLFLLENLSVLALFFNQCLERIAIVILERARIECTAFARDQLLGEIDHFLLRLDIRNVVEHGVALLEFLHIAQGFKQKSVAAWSHRDEILFAAYRHLPDARLLRRAQRVTDDDVAFRRNLVGG